jgi:N-acetylmuramoyl-L-alanine amidase
LLDARIHGKTWAILRLTRMPTVRVELGYLSSPIDRPMLVDPRFRDTVAEGLLVAVQRLYLPLADDYPTGVMRIPAVVGGEPPAGPLG